MGEREVLRREKENRALGMFRIKRKKRKTWHCMRGTIAGPIRKYKRIR